MGILVVRVAVSSVLDSLVSSISDWKRGFWKSERGSTVSPIFFLSFVFLTSVAQATTLSGPLQNGNFSVTGLSPEPFASWTTNLMFGDRPVNGGGFARFDVGGSVDAKQLEQSYYLADTDLQVSFDVRIERTGSPRPSAILDSFQSALYDSSFNPLLPRSSLFPAFFSIDNDGSKFFDPAFVSVTSLGGGVERVTLNVTSLPGQQAILEFMLLGSDDLLSTTVRLDNVSVVTAAAIVPEPVAIHLWLVGICLSVCRSFFGRSRDAMTR